MDKNLADRISALPDLNKAQLLLLWREKRPQKKISPGSEQGTRLLRSWHGQVHEVIVTDTGYVYRGSTYSSLSKIAREITGTQWSGPLFFGTRKKA